MARLDKDYFLRHNKPTAHSKSFTKAREITNRFKLKPGSYCIVASTFEPNREGDFLLRLFSEKEKKSEYVFWGYIYAQPETLLVVDTCRGFYHFFAVIDRYVLFNEYYTNRISKRVFSMA
jgi:hypothetical protein